MIELHLGGCNNPTCGCRMQKNDSTGITLRHLPFGGSYAMLNFDKVQLFCPKCKATKMQYVCIKKYTF